MNDLIVSSMSNLVTILLCENNFLVWPEYPNSTSIGPKIRNIRCRVPFWVRYVILEV